MVSLQAAIAAIALSGVGQTVLLDFYTDWCGPCKAMNPTVQALVAAGYPIHRINKDQNQALAAKYGVQSVPCFVMIVDGREVDRVVGLTTYSRLTQMCKLGAVSASPHLSPAMLAQNTAPAAPPSPVFSAPFDGWGREKGDRSNLCEAPFGPSRQIGPVPFSPPVSDAALLAASVRLRVEDSDGHSCGSGTIIDARGGEALILTCGHIFRDSQGKGRIDVDLFGPGGQQRVPGRLVSYDSEKRDVGLVAIRVPGPVVTARVAPPGYRISRDMPVVSVGCNNGIAPTAQHSQITSLDKFLGTPNIQVAGQPVEGRSGGGLFSSEGYVIGVCNAADPSDKEGLFAALGSIRAELDRAELAFVYRSPSENSAEAPEAAGPASLAANPLPAMLPQMPGPAELAAFNSAPGPTTEMPANLPPHEQAALEEIRRRAKEGAEVTIVVRPRDNPDAKSEVYQLDHASPGFLKQLTADVRPPNRPYQTSLELPRPRKILLEWSAEDGKTEGGRRKAETMDASPRISTQNTIMR